MKPGWEQVLGGTLNNIFPEIHKSGEAGVSTKIALFLHFPGKIIFV
jgi:hypothetical protein